MAYLQDNLSRTTQGAAVEVFGFDVHDDAVQGAGFLDRTAAFLGAQSSDTNWEGRLRSCSKDDPWPFDDQSFDLVVSNQVVEHVRSLDAFLSETSRVLKDGGVAVHLFPLRDYVIEGHLHLPFVHRISNFDLRRATITFLSRLGVGKFRHHAGDLAAYAEQHADFLGQFTHYRSWAEIARAAESVGFRVSYRYTPDFYWRRLASIAGRSYPFVLKNGGRSIRDAVWFRLLRLVSSVTIVLEKRQTYSHWN